MNPDPDVDAMARALERLASFSTADANCDEATGNNQQPEYSEKLQSRVDCLLSEAEKSRKSVDPKVRAAREKLPIFKKKAELIEKLEKHQVLIVIGETGSGKTTQIPQYLQEIGVAIKGRIGCTQLRRIAAKQVASTVAKQQGCKVGDEVGYTIRFDDKTGPKTQIQFMTDGILLRECTYDRTLTSYSAVILDESHERTVDTDILLGVLRWIISQRNDLKLIISSATLDADKFSSYFFNAEVFHINNRMYDIEIFYTPSSLYYVTAASKEVIRINEREEPGDVMVFMSGEADIEELHDLLLDYRNSLYPELVVLPCYSALAAEDQAKIFKPTEPGKRKVVIATNIAETSLTVDGIKYVIDSGWVKQKVYDHRREMEVLKRIRVSQAQAIQRSGRAGRVSSGKCYRLYSKGEYESFVSGPEPEIKRSSLTNAVLILKKMGFTDLNVFHFIDQPPAEAIKEAEDELILYSAIEAKTGEITEIGRKMASFPLEPNLAKMLVMSEQLNCSEEILTIVALLSTASIFFRPKKKAKQADAAKARFYTNEGDLIMMLYVFEAWLTYDRDTQWCYENFIHSRMMHEVEKIREQLYDTMITRSMCIKSAGSNTVLIKKSICSGLIQNVAQRSLGRRGHAYVTLPRHEVVYIHPGSPLFRIEPNWVVYQKVVQTNKAYMRGVTPIDPSWLDEFLPAYRRNASITGIASFLL